MKIISGFLKGRNIKGFNIEGTRPTMDRVKESLFGMIQDYVDDSIVLDLFSGSGNLGIEAISNGAHKVYFNDINRIAINTIKSNLKELDIENKAVVTKCHYDECLNSLKEKFNIIFLDPPYNNIILNDVIKKIMRRNLLNDNGIIVCEVSSNYLDSFSQLELIKLRTYGDKIIVIFKKTCN